MKKCKRKDCENQFDPKELAEKFTPVWWTDIYCSPECVLLDNHGYIMQCYSPETVRFSITLPAEIFDRTQRDARINSRTVNGQVNFVVRNYYVFKDIEDSRL